MSVFKTCSDCKECKPVSEFHKSGSTPDGIARICIACKSLRDRKYREDYQEQCNAKAKAHREDPKTKAHRNEYTRNRRLEDPVFREVLNSRSMVAKAMKRRVFSDNSKTAEYLCCSYDFFLEHLGGIPTGMSLQLDHICPLAQAKSVEEVIKLWHYSNLQLASNELNHDKFDGWSKEGAALCLSLLGRPWDLSLTNHVKTHQQFKKDVT